MTCPFSTPVLEVSETLVRQCTQHATRVAAGLQELNGVSFDLPFFKDWHLQVLFLKSIATATEDKAAIVRATGLSKKQYEAFVAFLEAGFREASVDAPVAVRAVGVLESAGVQAYGGFELFELATNGSLQTRLGPEKIRKVANAFYRKLLGDPTTARFFDGYDMAALRVKQANFLSFVFGEAKDYKGRNMRKVHLPLIRDKGLSVRHFDIAVKYFLEACKEADVHDEDTEAGRQKIISARKFFTAPTAQELEQMQPLCERIGAVPLRAVVDLLYEKLLADSRITFFFEGFSVPKQRKKMNCYLTKILGGDISYEPKDMRAVHLAMIRDKGLGLEHIDIFQTYLRESCQHNRLPKNLEDELIEVVETVRPYFMPLTDEEKTVEIGSMFGRVGGAPFIDKIAQELYHRVIADERLNPFFKGIDMEKLQKKVAGLLTFVFGGEAERFQHYDLRAAHANMIKHKGLTLELVDVFIRHFKESLEELDCTQGIVAEATAALARHQDSFRPFEPHEQFRSFKRVPTDRIHPEALAELGLCPSGRPSASALSHVGSHLSREPSTVRASGTLGATSMDGRPSSDGMHSLSSTVKDAQAQPNPEVVDVHLNSRQFCVTC